MIFLGPERGPDDLLMEYFQCGVECLPWTEFKSFGCLAVMEAGWRCADLERISQQLRERRCEEFDDNELCKLREEARERKKRISVRNSGGSISRFDWS